MKLTLNEDEAIFIQIAKVIEGEILIEEIKEHEQIQSITEISKLYKVNPATVLKGINTLVDKDILYKKRGIGMFVNDGAKEIIRNFRKENFKNIFIRELLIEAKKLQIEKQELIDMIKSYKEVE